MAEAELDLENMTVPGLLAAATGVAAALRDHPDFPAPQPPPQELERLAGELGAAEEEYRQQRRLASQAQAVRDSAVEALRQALGEEVAYVQAASAGEITKILSANLHVEEETRLWPFGSVGAVEELSASLGDEAGEIDLAWDPVTGASGYEIEVAYDIAGEGPWEEGGATTHSKTTIGKLDHRTRYWFRVRAVAENGAGDWCPPVMKFAH